MPAKERLILTFDAFGTLFKPREPIAKSYADTARSCGLSGFTNDQIASRFRDAFKEESRKAPNYGKQMGMAAPQWWTSVIQATFRPFSSSSTLPDDIVPKLLRRFSSSEGYMLYPDVVPLFDGLRYMKREAEGDSNVSQVRVGIITNSDDRVIPILSSFGLVVGSLRAGRRGVSDIIGVHSDSKIGEMSDIDFVTLSYDVGFEKPSYRIFDAARKLANSGEIYKGRDRYIHVGDDMDKDVKGAQQAGWEGLFLDREKEVESCKHSIHSMYRLAPHIPGLFSHRLQQSSGLMGN